MAEAEVNISNELMESNDINVDLNKGIKTIFMPQ